jgi:hypothetical protein
MLDSDFWHDLAVSFDSVHKLYEFSAHRASYMGSTVEPTWTLEGERRSLSIFDALARRGARMLEPPPTGNLALGWLEALWYEATHGPVRSTSEVMGQPQFPKEPLHPPVQVRGKIDRVFEASSALCRKFESVALQTEFEAEQRKKLDAKLLRLDPIPEAATAPLSNETIAAQIQRLRDECRLTTEELAEKIELEPRSVQRHIAGDSIPYTRNLRRYETEFSKLLKRQVVIRKLP